LQYFEAIRALHRHLDIGVVKDDERGIAAQLERQLFDNVGSLLEAGGEVNRPALLKYYSFEALIDCLVHLCLPPLFLLNLMP
jgi:hypothetical protein